MLIKLTPSSSTLIGWASASGRGSADEAADKRSTTSAFLNILIELKCESPRKDGMPNRKETQALHYIRELLGMMSAKIF